MLISECAAGLAAAFNFDGAVDAANFAIWQQDFATDADRDSDFNGADFPSWQRQATGGASSAPAVAMPEPTTTAALRVCGATAGTDFPASRAFGNG